MKRVLFGIFCSVTFGQLFTSAPRAAENTPPQITIVPDQTVRAGESSPVIEFSVSDSETAPDLLVVEAHSSNPAILPDTAIFLGTLGGANRRFFISPPLGSGGTVVVTLTVMDGAGKSTSTFFNVTVLSPPSISGIADQFAPANRESAVINFTVSDVDTPATNLKVAVQVADSQLVPASNIQLQGSGSAKQMILIPAPNRTGTTTVTVTVTDSTGLSASTSFQFHVANAPTISAVADQRVLVNTVLGPLPFEVADAETAAGFLRVTVSSSNPGLVPENAIALAGSASSRTLTITPAAEQTGQAQITLTVTDTDGFATFTAFNLTVVPINHPPAISTIGNQSMDEDQTLGPILFTVADAESPAASLQLRLASSNTNLVPTENVLFAGSGSSRTVVVIPKPNQSGATLITITVDDGELTTNASFTLTVNPVNDPPTLGSFSNLTIEANQTTQVPLVFSDLETPPERLNVAATSSNNTLAPSSSLVLSRTGPPQLLITPAPGQSGSTLIVVKITDEGGLSAERSFSLTVNPPPLIPPDITTQPQSQTVLAGADVTFAVTATGSAPLIYQWLFNGFPLPGETAPALRLSNVASAQAGAYSVNISNAGGSVASQTVKLVVNIPPPANDNFQQSAPLPGLNAALITSNISGSVEPGEPPHAGRPGGASVWWSWTAPVSGRAAISTTGSSFDTLLAVYLGDSLSGLNVVAQNDDEPGGASTSRVEFDAIAGKNYRIAVDGFAGASGELKLNLFLKVNPPELRVGRSGSRILLSWPAAAAGFVLQTSERLGAEAVWPDLTTAAQADPTEISLALEPLGGAKFFRLKRAE